MSDVAIATTDGVLTVRWDAPDRLNGLTAAMLNDAAAAIESIGDDVRCILITGTGRAFSSGAALTGGEDDDLTGTLDGINRLIRAITAAPAPVVVGMNGLAAGAAASIALAADLALAKESSYLLLAFVNIGLMPDGGATELVAAAIGRTRANRMAMLGERLPSPQAVADGLIHATAPDDDFDAELDALVQRLATGPTQAFRAMKAAINAATLPTLDASLERERVGQVALFDTFDAKEGPAAFREKRPAAFEGR